MEVRILVEKWNMYEAHIFPRSLVQTCWFESNSLCLNTRLSVNKDFRNSHNFYWNLVNRRLLCAHPLMTSIIFHPRRPNTQENVSYVLDFLFQLMLNFRILWSWIARFSHRFISLYELCTKDYRVFGWQYSCIQLK